MLTIWRHQIQYIELQGMFRNCCQIIWGWAVNVTAQICQSTNAVNIAVEVRTFFQWKHHMVNFSVQKCVGAEDSYKGVIFEHTLIWCLRWVVDSDTFFFLSFIYSEL